MKRKEYIPQPFDTSDVLLPGDLESLIERLARNVHEVWAEERVAEGWQYGEKRDDEHKRHPCLIPYDELLDSEKMFDRNTAKATLKLIVKLGFDIVKR